MRKCGTGCLGTRISRTDPASPCDEPATVRVITLRRALGPSPVESCWVLSSDWRYCDAHAEDDVDGTVMKDGYHRVIVPVGWDGDPCALVDVEEVMDL